jgi:hypothetical protein
MCSHVHDLAVANTVRAASPSPPSFFGSFRLCIILRGLAYSSVHLQATLRLHCNVYYNLTCLGTLPPSHIIGL